LLRPRGIFLCSDRRTDMLDDDIAGVSRLELDPMDGRASKPRRSRCWIGPIT
jgi:hypothetical protein